MNKTYKDIYNAYSLINKEKGPTCTTTFKVTKITWSNEDFSSFIEMYDEDHAIHVRYSSMYIQIAIINEGRKLTLDLNPDPYYEYNGYWSELDPEDFENDRNVKKSIKYSDEVEEKYLQYLFAPWNE